MSTTVRRFILAAPLVATALWMFRALQRLIHRPRRRRAEPLGGLSDHLLRDLGVARTAVMAFRSAEAREREERNRR